MSILFRGQDLIKVAVQIEENGAIFYKKLISRTKQKDLKALFKCLHNEEKSHIEYFKKLSSSMKEYDPPESYLGEYEAYVKDLADHHIFGTKGAADKALKKLQSILEASDLALEFEKDSILFFTEMLIAVPPEDKQIVESLIEEERKHLSQLCTSCKVCPIE